MMLNGLTVIESVYLTQPGTPYVQRRSWRERLCSRPWRPWHATRLITPMVPYPGAIQINTTTVVMHPATVQQLRRNLDVLL